MAPVVVVVGGVNTDMVVQTPHLPRPGETVGGGSFLTTPGGKGANQAVAAARLGATVRLIGKVGVDSFGEAARDNLRRYGIDTAGLGRDPSEPSGVALIFVDAAGENAIAVAPGANMALTADDVEAQEGLLAGAEVVVGQCEVPAEATLAAFRLARDRGIRTVLNAAPAMPLSAAWSAVVDTLVVNEGEAALIGRGGRADRRFARCLGRGFAAFGLRAGDSHVGSAGRLHRGGGRSDAGAGVERGHD